VKLMLVVSCSPVKLWNKPLIPYQKSKATTIPLGLIANAWIS
jgi:hypothetical protein